MSKINHLFRIAVTMSFGLAFAYKLYWSQYHDSLIDIVVYFFLIVLGLGFWGWTLYKDLSSFQRHKKPKFLISTIIGVGMITFLFILDRKVNLPFQQATLLKIKFDTEWDLYSIDLKKDGTYIFSHSYFFDTDFQYGTYQIEGNKITLDKDKLFNILESNKLEIITKEVLYLNGSKENETFVYQIDSSGNVLENEAKFVIVKVRRGSNNRIDI